MNASSHTYRKGQVVEVKTRARNGSTNSFLWVPGTVDRAEGKGAFVRLKNASGGGVAPIDFYYWNEMRPCDEPTEARQPPPSSVPEALNLEPLSKPFATIGDAVKTQKPEEPQKTESKSSKTPTSEPAKPKANPKLVRNWALGATRIGEHARQARVKRNLSQYDVADLFRVRQDVVSRMERGEELPSDDYLVNLAEHLGLNLDEMIELREQDRERLDRERAKAREEVVVSNAKPDEKKMRVQGFTAPKPPEVVPTHADGFELFVEKLVEVSPLPLDRTARARWFALARELFALGL